MQPKHNKFQPDEVWRHQHYMVFKYERFSTQYNNLTRLLESATKTDKKFAKGTLGLGPPACPTHRDQSYLKSHSRPLSRPFKLSTVTS